MVAAKRFLDGLNRQAARITVELFGSLAWTGRGHGTPTAICLGLLGETVAEVDPDSIERKIMALRSAKSLSLPDGGVAAFDPETDLTFDFDTLLPRHPNGMRFHAYGAGGSRLTVAVCYSIGGGFVVFDDEELAESSPESVSYPFSTADELLSVTERTGLSIASLQRENEARLKPGMDIDAGLDAIRDAMYECIERGLRTEGLLPGKLKFPRRAKGLYDRLLADRLENQARPHEIMDWVSTYAIAVNEENAAGGRVVTAPTNGAAGTVPAVLRYFRDFCKEYSNESARVFLLTAAAIGGLIKRNASLSGAEVGCQGEVGSAAAMAAAGLSAALGATPAQVENAAEIAMEHHLGMTCDPIEGLVQIPCIERNALGANKAIVAASLALKGDGTHRVSLDEVIETMRQTGVDMQSKYKETSLGGLAVNVVNC
jgi:L-serine dehydratase